MGDAPFLNSEGPAQTSPPPAENSVFQSQSPVFVLMRICIYIALTMGISFVLQWIMAALLAGDRSLYSPKILAISEGSSLAGAPAAGQARLRQEWQCRTWKGAHLVTTAFRRVAPLDDCFGTAHCSAWRRSVP